MASRGRFPDEAGRRGVSVVGGDDWASVEGVGRRSKSWRPDDIEVDEATLGASVARALTERCGRPVRVTSLVRRPSPYATVFPADVVEVRLADGGAKTLFVKYLGTEEGDHPDKLGPEREIGLYRDILDGEGLPVVRCYGAPWDTRLGRYQLLLEHVNDWNLKYHDLSAWYRAAHELGRLHAWFAQRVPMLEKCGVLTRLDGAYVWGWARRAGEEAARRGPILRNRLQDLLRGYHPVPATLEAAPATLVHNDLSPKNVIADRSQEPPRICLVDWESAGIGCGLLDLTNLSYGLDEEAQTRMRESYRTGLTAAGAEAPEGNDVARQALASEAHKALWRLAHCGVWDLPEKAVHGFAAEAEAALRALLAPVPDLGER